MLVIKNAVVYKGTGEAPTVCDILCENGKIARLGVGISVPDSAETIDAGGLFAMPGIVDAHCHVGGFTTTDPGDDDLNEMSASATPEMEALYSIDPANPSFAMVRSAGITTMGVTPGSGNVICGLACAVKSYGTRVSEMCIKNGVAMKMALGGNPKGVYGKRNMLPMTRMGIASIIRTNLAKAKEYAGKKEEAAGDPEKKPSYDAGMENLCRVLRREMPIKVHCEQFDMLTIFRIADEFDIELTIEHGWGASDFYDEFGAAKNLRGVVFGPIGVELLPGECGKVDIECLAELTRRGVTCAIMTDGPVLHPEMIVEQAGEAVRTGSRHLDVLDMLTINPAKILGVEARVGSLEVGKDADIALFSGTPALDVTAMVRYTVVDGRIVYRAGS
jgi:imidazolonepropionase-like amidohydrolase